MNRMRMIMHQKQGVNGQWSSRWVFILAAAGSAIGLGNIWKFPYITGEHGGGAFVLIYLVCIMLIGIPIMIAEVMLGRRSRMSPINALMFLARESNASSWWVGIGWSGVLAGVLILSFYSVIAGWSLHYLMLSISGELDQIDAQTSGELFNALLSNIDTLIVWHTLFLLITLGLVAGGVIKGVGVAVRYLMPLLFILLLLLTGYSAVEGNLSAALQFLFQFNIQSVKSESILVALGHAFFTLSIGMGAIMAYGAYLPESVTDKYHQPKKVNLGSTVVIIAVLDTVVALLAGLVIFSVVFANPTINPSDGPGLLFVSLPVALNSMPLGSLYATVFFFLVFIAALSSAISLTEPTVAWLVENKGWSRLVIVSILGLIIWLLGLGTVFSFNIASDATLLGHTFFDLLDFVTANLMLPLGGLFIAVFAGWVMKQTVVASEVGDVNRGVYRWWYIMLRYVSPLLLGYVFVMALIDKVGG